MEDKRLYIIAGCNGAGKTTASYAILPHVIGIVEFVNADEIAKGLSPFNPEDMAIKAGRLMLERINELLDAGKSFALETTLATRSYIHLVRQARQRGYTVQILFFYLKTVALAKQRVAERVAQGGHNIPPNVIERRYHAGLRNLLHIFMDEVDRWVIYDNSDGACREVASGGRAIQTAIKEPTIYLNIQQHERQRV